MLRQQHTSTLQQAASNRADALAFASTTLSCPAVPARHAPPPNQHPTLAPQRNSPSRFSILHSTLSQLFKHPSRPPCSITTNHPCRSSPRRHTASFSSEIAVGQPCSPSRTLLSLDLHSACSTSLSCCSVHPPVCRWKYLCVFTAPRIALQYSSTRHRAHPSDSPCRARRVRSHHPRSSPLPIHAPPVTRTRCLPVRLIPLKLRAPHASAAFPRSALGDPSRAHSPQTAHAAEYEEEE